MRQLASEDRKGVILPFASLGGIAGTYNCPIYIATKHGIVGFVKSMKLLEKYEGIKVVTICPGAVDSPLWTSEKRERTHFNKVESLKPDDVAKAMIDLVQDGKYGGGTLLEIMPNNGPKTRVIPEWNIDPPQGGYVWAKMLLKSSLFWCVKTCADCGAIFTRSLTQVLGSSNDIPPAFQEMKDVMDADRAKGKK